MRAAILSRFKWPLEEMTVREASAHAASDGHFVACRNCRTHETPETNFCAQIGLRPEVMSPNPHTL